MSLEEIAGPLGIALGTVKSSLHRAVHRLRDRLSGPRGGMTPLARAPSATRGEPARGGRTFGPGGRSARAATWRRAPAAAPPDALVAPLEQLRADPVRQAEPRFPWACCWRAWTRLARPRRRRGRGPPGRRAWSEPGRGRGGRGGCPSWPLRRWSSASAPARRRRRGPLLRSPKTPSPARAQRGPGAGGALSGRRQDVLVNVAANPPTATAPWQEAGWTWRPSPRRSRELLKRRALSRGGRGSGGAERASRAGRRRHPPRGGFARGLRARGRCRSGFARTMERAAAADEDPPHDPGAAGEEAGLLAPGRWRPWLARCSRRAAPAAAAQPDPERLRAAKALFFDQQVRRGAQAWQQSCRPRGRRARRRPTGSPAAARTWATASGPSASTASSWTAAPDRALAEEARTSRIGLAASSTSPGSGSTCRAQDALADPTRPCATTQRSSSPASTGGRRARRFPC